MGPPWDSNSFSSFIIWTIFWVNLCIANCNTKKWKILILVEKLQRATYSEQTLTYAVSINHPDLERLIICSKANAWNIFQPNRKPPEIKRKKKSKSDERNEFEEQKPINITRKDDFVTQNSTPHKHKAQCEDARIAQLCGPSW